MSETLTQESLELARGISDWYGIGAALHSLANLAIARATSRQHLPSLTSRSSRYG